ncbi:MAG: hypothetical protein ACREQJ_02940 [Candidatus Binatia bacterium]
MQASVGGAPVERVIDDFRDAVERAAADVFVGRARELAELDAALERAISGRGALVLLAGEPGISRSFPRSATRSPKFAIETIRRMLSGSGISSPRPNSIRMGTFCSYTPERSVSWLL